MDDFTFFYFCVVFPLTVDNFVHTLDYTAELQGRQIKKKTCAMMTTHMLTICHRQFRTLLLLLVYRTILPIHLPSLHSSPYHQHPRFHTIHLLVIFPIGRFNDCSLGYHHRCRRQKMRSLLSIRDLFLSLFLCAHPQQRQKKLSCSFI